MSQKRMWTGIVGSAFQTVAAAAIGFLSYRVLRMHVGDERYGLWAAVGAVTMAGNLAELGMGMGALRFVSLHLGRGDTRAAHAVAQTALLTAPLFVGGLMLALSPVLPHVLRFALGAPMSPLLDEATRLLPWVLGLYVAQVTQGVCLYCLDGADRVALRNALVIASTVLGLLLVLWRVPTHGLVGFAQAQLLQVGATTAVGWGLLRRALPGLPWLPHRWNRVAFGDLVRYGARWQGVALVNLFTEPLARLLIGRLGGFVVLGHYDAATKLVLPLRNAIVAAQQALLPVIARASLGAEASLRDLYAATLRVTGGLVGAALPVLVVAAPLASLVWLGRYDATFATVFVCVAAAWMLNALTGPAYFDHVGTDRMRPIVIGHRFTAVCVPLFVAAGHALGGAVGGVPGLGALAGALAATGSGALVPLVALHRRQRFGKGEIVRPRDRRTAVGLALLGGASIAGAAALPTAPVTTALQTGLVLLVAAALLVLHPDVAGLRSRFPMSSSSSP